MMSSPKVNNEKIIESDYSNENEASHTSSNKNSYYKQETPPRYKNKEPDLKELKIIDVDSAFDQVLVTIDKVKGRVQYFPNYISLDEADNLYKYLAKNIDWQQREGTSKNGDTYHEPRLTFWFGKPYKYSSVQWESNTNWDKEIDNLRVRLNQEHPVDEHKEYNSVMCNYYRNNIDSIGWHSDDEISLGRFPKIASISLGCERVFEVCRRVEYFSRCNNYGPRNLVFAGCTILYRFHLNPGSLLIMEGSIQEEFLHRVPKENSPMNGRINLTYRYIVSEEDEKLEKERRQKIRKPQHKYVDRTYNDGYQQNQYVKNEPRRYNGYPNISHISDWISKDNYLEGKFKKQYSSNVDYYDNEIKMLKNKGKRSTEGYKDHNSDSYNESNQANRNHTNNKRNKSNSVNEEVAYSDFKRFNKNKEKNRSTNSNESEWSRNKSNNKNEKLPKKFSKNDQLNEGIKNNENNEESNKKETKTENKHQEIDIKGQNWSDVRDEDKVLLPPDSFSGTNNQEGLIYNKSSPHVTDVHEKNDNAVNPTDSLPESGTEKQIFLAKKNKN